MEHERKYVKAADVPPELVVGEALELEQGYIRTRGEAESRIRLGEAEKAVFTIKEGSGASREELEAEVWDDELTHVWPLAYGRRVGKYRRPVVLEDGRKADWDTYVDDLEGLEVIEVEFETAKEMEAFVPPVWFGEEVTNDKRYKNKSLAVFGLPGSEHEPRVSIVDLDEGLNGLEEYIKLRQRTKPGVVTVAVAGGSASGKTSAVAKEIRDRFGNRATLLSLDDYYHGTTYMDRMAFEHGLSLNYDQPEAVNLALAGEHLAVLGQGGKVEKPVYSMKTGEPEGSVIVDASMSDVIIVEGLFALNPEIAQAADVTVFVDINMHGRLMRRLMRDVTRTAWEPGTILKYFAETLEAMHQKYVEPTKANADVIVNNGFQPSTEAIRTGQHEAQVKFKNEGLTPEKLRQMGAVIVGPRVVHRDVYYFAGEDQFFQPTGESVRLREVNGELYFGYKGPREPNDTARQRAIMEFTVGPVSEFPGIDMLYHNVDKAIIKKRTMFMLGGVAIALDEEVQKEHGPHLEYVDGYGDWLELQTDDTPEGLDRLDKVQARLGLDPNKADFRSYQEF